MGRKVVIITYQFSVVVKGLEKELSNEGYDVELIGDDVNEIKDRADETDAFVLYLTDKVLDDPKNIKNLITITDAFRNHDRNPILIGDAKNRDPFMKVVPAFSDYQWVLRPIKLEDLVAAVHNEKARVERNLQRKRVLIVDDDPTFASIVAAWLGDSYNTYVVNDGMQTITFVSAHNVDLILLDYEMPVVDGPQLLEMLQSHPDTMHIPVIFLTGKGDKASIQRVLKLKPEGYLLKSTPRAELIKTVDEFFEKRDSESTEEL